MEALHEWMFGCGARGSRDRAAEILIVPQSYLFDWRQRTLPFYRLRIRLCVIDSPAGLWSAWFAVTLTRTWMISIASAYRGHARPRVSR
jgi:hypothetical protein